MLSCYAKRNEAFHKQMTKPTIEMSPIVDMTERITYKNYKDAQKTNIKINDKKSKSYFTIPVELNCNSYNLL
jgi:hypothetical protein